MLRYLIAVPISDVESGEFVQLRDTYSSYAPKWHITLGPHITIVRPSPAKIDIDNAVELFTPSDLPGEFRVRFSSFDAFMNNDSCAVFAKPNETVKLQELRNRCLPISKNILNLDPNDWPFLPHLTLVNRLSRDAAKEVLKGLHQVNFSMNYLINRVVLYKKDQSDALWKEIAECKLTKG